MRTSIIYALFLALGVLSVTSAGATSLVTPAPHDPDKVCAAITRLVDNLGEGKPWGDEPQEIIFFYSDRFGEVERGEREAFVESMLSMNGERDRRKMRVEKVHRLLEHDHWPQYLITISRSVWKLTRWVDNGMLIEEEVEDPHWSYDRSVWLVQYHNNHIHSVREASELTFLQGKLEPLRDC